MPLAREDTHIEVAFTTVDNVVNDDIIIRKKDLISMEIIKDRDVKNFKVT